ncbi:hypothetical protein QCA50_015728 [Cerrena zonata]|uniref:Uncharacterized protein n=1 Tax=Cerrena zonata TaxID=2478898 RepID=A0AAW0FHA7_9APHY
MSFGSKAAQRLANKVILITGASSGIGEATAREITQAAAGNVKLILAARREDRLTLGKDQVGDLLQEDIQGMFQTNVLGLINLTQAVLPIFKKKNSGDIVNIGSVAGHESYPGGSVYCSSKAAVKFFSQSLRKELINTKIRVLEVDPGAVETEFSLVRFKQDAQAAKKVYEGTTPLDASDIAEIIVFGLSRKQNTVIAETLVFPSHQASSVHVHKG